MLIMKLQGVGVNMKMSPAEYVIDLFGGVRALSRIIGKSPSAISNWRKNRRIHSNGKGCIPSSSHLVILKEARRHKLDITPDDLIYGRTVDKK